MYSLVKTIIVSEKYLIIKYYLIIAGILGPYYRLGEEYTYLVYVNQYSIHSHALSKSQNKEVTFLE